MVTVRGIKTLSVLKMEKNFIGVIDKGKPRAPYNVYSISSLALFIRLEYKELEFELQKRPFDYLAIRNELADLSNTIDFLYEAISGLGES